LPFCSQFALKSGPDQRVARFAALSRHGLGIRLNGLISKKSGARAPSEPPSTRIGANR
jgi:hypothetical protein